MLVFSEVLEYICFEWPSHIEHQQIIVKFIEFKRRSKKWQVETVIQQGKASFLHLTLWGGAYLELVFYQWCCAFKIAEAYIKCVPEVY
jgi:hypothetical protein